MVQLTLKWRIQAFFCTVIALTMLTGCIGTLFSYRGAVVAQPDNRFAFKESDQQAVWKTNELAVTYQYRKTSASLKISGNVKLLGGFATGFNAMKYLNVNLLFLDRQGAVIENALIFSAGAGRRFEKTIPVPDGTDSFSFAYDGLLVAAEGCVDSVAVP